MAEVALVCQIAAGFFGLLAVAFFCISLCCLRLAWSEYKRLQAPFRSGRSGKI